MHKVTFLCAKSRIAPINGCTVEKLEINGCMQLSRLLKSCVNAIIDKPKLIIPAGDSQCLIASLKLWTSKFKPFFINRIAEIKYNMSQGYSIAKEKSLYQESSQKNGGNLG